MVSCDCSFGEFNRAGYNRWVRRHGTTASAIAAGMSVVLALVQCLTTAWASYDDPQPSNPPLPRVVFGLWTQCFTSRNAFFHDQSIVCAPILTSCESLYDSDDSIQFEPCKSFLLVRAMAVMSIFFHTLNTIAQLIYIRTRSVRTRVPAIVATGLADLFTFFAALTFVSFRFSLPGDKFVNASFGWCFYVTFLTLFTSACSINLFLTALAAIAQRRVERQVRSLTFDVGVRDRHHRAAAEYDAATDASQEELEADSNGCCDGATSIISIREAPESSHSIDADTDPEDEHQPGSIPHAGAGTPSHTQPIITTKLHWCVPISAVLTGLMLLCVLIASFTPYWTNGYRDAWWSPDRYFGLYEFCFHKREWLCYSVDLSFCRAAWGGAKAVFQNCNRTIGPARVLLVSAVGCIAFGWSAQCWTLWRRRKGQTLSRIRFLGMAALIASGGLIAAVLSLWFKFSRNELSAILDGKLAFGAAFGLLITAAILSIPATLCFACGAYKSTTITEPYQRVTSAMDDHSLLAIPNYDSPQPLNGSATPRSGPDIELSPLPVHQPNGGGAAAAVASSDSPTGAAAFSTDQKTELPEGL